MGENIDKLREDQLLAGELPAEYERFIDGLSKETIDELVSLKQILEEKEITVMPIRLKEKGIKVLPIFAVTKSMPVL